jgi:hypothetical protein
MLPPFFLPEPCPPGFRLAFLVTVGNNSVGTVMRLACGLAIALWLSFPAAGMDSRQQDTAGSANSAGQAPAPPAAPVEQSPAETAPPAVKRAPENVTKQKANTGAASATTKRRKRTISTPSPTPDGTPLKIVVREGGAREPAALIAPGMTPAEAVRQRQNAEQLLGSTDDQLKQLTVRMLDARQQETAGQIRNYMDGARTALKEGDLRRASTLAEKAHLLAEDMVKH